MESTSESTLEMMVLEIVLGRIVLAELGCLEASCGPPHEMRYVRPTTARLLVALLHSSPVNPVPQLAGLPLFVVGTTIPGGDAALPTSPAGVVALPAEPTGSPLGSVAAMR